MTTKTMTHSDLAAGIERLVRDYISTIRIAAAGAVDRAVAVRVGGGGRPLPSAKAGQPTAAPSRQGRRRAADEIGALSERFYEALCRTPGETMTVLAPVVGATARELNRSVLLLRRAGRIRSVGTKHQTRYFPMAREAQRPLA
jgi:HAMP domain-containing protein